MSLFNNIYAATFPYLVDQPPEFDVSNVTPGWNEEQPVTPARNNFIPYAPTGRIDNTHPDNSPESVGNQHPIEQPTPVDQPPLQPQIHQENVGSYMPNEEPPPVDMSAKYAAQNSYPATTLEAPQLPDKYLSKKVRNAPPPFQPDPNASAAQNKLAQLQYEAEHPVDKDQGFKGRLREVLSNFLYGLGQTPPGASVKQALLLGGIGAGAGAFNRTWNERRQAEQELPEAMRNVQFQTDQLYKAAQTNYMNARPAIATAANTSKEIVATIKDTGLTNRAKSRELTSIYNRTPIFDATDPDNAEFVNKMRDELGVTLPTKNGKTKTDLIPDQRTGQYYTVSKDEAGNVEIHKALKDDGTPWVAETAQMLTAEDRAKQRDLQAEIAKQRNVTAIRVADIGVKGHIDVENIRQEGKEKDREAKRIEFETKFNADIAQKRAAGQYKKTEYVGKIQAAVQAKTMTQDYANKLIESLPE